MAPIKASPDKMCSSRFGKSTTISTIDRLAHAKKVLQENRREKDLEAKARPKAAYKNEMRAQIEAAQHAFLTAEAKKLAVDAYRIEIRQQVITELKNDLRDSVYIELRDELKAEVVENLRKQHEVRVILDLRESLYDEVVTNLSRDLKGGVIQMLRKELFETVNARLEAEIRPEVEKRVQEEAEQRIQAEIPLPSTHDSPCNTLKRSYHSSFASEDDYKENHIPLKRQRSDSYNNKREEFEDAYVQNPFQSINPYPEPNPNLDNATNFDEDTVDKDAFNEDAADDVNSVASSTYSLNENNEALIQDMAPFGTYAKYREEEFSDHSEVDGDIDETDVDEKNMNNDTDEEEEDENAEDDEDTDNSRRKADDDEDDDDVEEPMHYYPAALDDEERVDDGDGVMGDEGEENGNGYHDEDEDGEEEEVEDGDEDEDEDGDELSHNNNYNILTPDEKVDLVRRLHDSHSDSGFGSNSEDESEDEVGEQKQEEGEDEEEEKEHDMRGQSKDTAIDLGDSD